MVPGSDEGQDDETNKTDHVTWARCPAVLPASTGMSVCL